jgi:hypothetical protein
VVGRGQIADREKMFTSAPNASSPIHPTRRGGGGRAIAATAHHAGPEEEEEESPVPRRASAT